LYEIHVNQQILNFLDSTNTQVKYPTKPSSFFDNANPEMQALIMVSTAGLFRVMQDESISIASICHFMTLISTLIVREREKKKCDVHSVMPDTFIMFAKNSRVHNGYRLLERAVRHATDPRCPNFMEETASISIHNGVLFLDLCGKVRASMKSNTYDTRVAFLCADLIACTCTCQSGSQGSDQHVCVHILAKAYQLTLLLYEGLAENILIELHIRLLHDTALVTALQEHELVGAIKKLMAAAGIPCGNAKSSIACLETFALSTSRIKRAPKHAKPCDLGLLRTRRFIAPEQKACRIIKGENINEAIGNANNKHPVHPVQLDPNDSTLKCVYHQMQVLCNAINMLFMKKFQKLVVSKEDRKNCIGNWLLNTRSQQSIMDDVAHHLLKTEKAVDDLDAAIRSLHQGSPRKTMDSTAEIVPLHSTRKRTAAVSSISATAV